ncbi:vWA domain-containing protein [Streptomyces kebangsaanensis]|uniref:vWA domain-containing protein n=1 Tax=Streptomyces kebangsaanensis TaxID=864058 RepID=UPI00093FB959|nr:caspase family protein [Streptomyces kebangsaanensis]
MDRFDPRGRVNRALLVGVSEYDHKKPAEPDGVPGDLPAVRHNLERLEDVLRRGGLFGEDGITVRSSPSLDEFSEELRTAAHRAEGLLLCYFAGHGAVPSAGNELFLQMRNARVVAGGQAVFPGAEAFTGMLTVLAGSPAERIVVILDCCYAGNAAKVWHDFTDRRQGILLLMSVQANRLIDSGDGERETPFTEELVRLLDSDGESSLLDLFKQVRGAMARAHRATTLGDPWEPQFAGEPDTDVLLGVAREGEPAPSPGPTDGSGGSVPGGGPKGPRPHLLSRALTAGLARLRGRAGAVVRWFGGLRGRVRVTVGALLVLALALAGLELGGHALIGSGDGRSCAPPLELRLLTDPELEPTVRAAADAYLVSDANTTGHGCRRTGITVYSAGASSVITALRRQADAWQDPLRGDTDTNPQRDVGPQPDVWIPASGADVARAVTGQTDLRSVVFDPDPEPFAYSPVVLAVPQDLAGDGLDERVGLPLSRLTADLSRRDRNARVLRPDPELTDSALLATIGLYGGGTAAPRNAEQGVRSTGPPPPTAAELLCALPADRAADRRTAALVPEFLLRSGVDCARRIRVRRTAEYPDDVPALTPTFVRVRWEDGDRDAEARDDAAKRFRAWLTGEGGRAAFGAAGFRHATSPGHPLLDDQHVGAGVLRLPSPLPGRAEQAAMETALEGYRNSRGPGRVLYLLDSSGSMHGKWPGPSGGPGILRQSLSELGPRDEYGVWAVYDTAGDRGYEALLPFEHHRRAEAERVLDAGARVRDAEADPHAALLAALEYMDRRGTDDERPRLIVYITDDEDNNRLTGGNLEEVLARAGRVKVPVVMVSLVSGSCDRGRADARIAEASGGRCLDAGDNPGRGLREEIARVGTEEE